MKKLLIILMLLQSTAYACGCTDVQTYHNTEMTKYGQSQYYYYTMAHQQICTRHGGGTACNKLLTSKAVADNITTWQFMTEIDIEKTKRYAHCRVHGGTLYECLIK